MNASADGNYRCNQQIWPMCQPTPPIPSRGWCLVHRPIEQAGELSIELIIVRVSAKPRDDGTPNEPDALAEYTSELSDYLTAEGVRYIDMTGHPGIDAGMYYDGYHLIYRYRSHYTEIFSEWLLSNRGANP